MLETVAEGLWAVPKPLSVFGLGIGTRMTVLRLADGTLALHSPVRVDDDEKRAIDALGDVSAIVVPNGYHDLYHGDASARWPGARLFAPPALRAKAKEVRWAEGRAPVDAALESRAFDGAPGADEIVLFHAPSGALVFTDLLFYYPESPRGLAGMYARWQKVVGKIGTTAVSRSLVKDRKAARASFDALGGLGASRISVTHGGVWAGDAAAAIRDATRWLGG